MTTAGDEGEEGEQKSRKGEGRRRGRGQGELLSVPHCPCAICSTGTRGHSDVMLDLIICQYNNKKTIFK